MVWVSVGGVLAAASVFWWCLGVGLFCWVRFLRAVFWRCSGSFWAFYVGGALGGHIVCRWCFYPALLHDLSQTVRSPDQGGCIHLKGSQSVRRFVGGATHRTLVLLPAERASFLHGCCSAGESSRNSGTIHAYHLGWPDLTLIICLSLWQIRETLSCREICWGFLRFSQFLVL